MTSRTERLGRHSDLQAEPPDRKEFESLVRSGLARLRDAENTTLSIDSRFDLAHSAAHALCLAALRHCGFRSAKRYVVFQVLPDTLGLGPEVWRLFEKAHRVRNQAEYEGIVEVEENLIRDLVAGCRQVAEKLEALPPLS